MCLSYFLNIQLMSNYEIIVGDKKSDNEYDVSTQKYYLMILIYNY